MKHRGLCVMLTACLLLSGCGQYFAKLGITGRQEDAADPGPERELQPGALAAVADTGNQVEWDTQAPPEEFPGDRAAFDLLIGEWKDAGELANVEKFWSATEYRENIFERPKGLKFESAISSAADNGVYYLVMGYMSAERSSELVYGTGSDVRFFLNSLDAETLTAKTAEIDLGSLAGEHVRVVGFDAAGGELTLFVQQTDGDYEIQRYWDYIDDPGAEGLTALRYYAVRMTPDGRADASSMIDLLPALKESGIPFSPWNFGSAGRDGRGKRKFFVLL